MNPTTRRRSSRKRRGRRSSVSAICASGTARARDSSPTLTGSPCASARTSPTAMCCSAGSSVPDAAATLSARASMVCGSVMNAPSLMGWSGGAAGELGYVASEGLSGELETLGHGEVRRPGSSELVDGHARLDGEHGGLDDLAGTVGDDAGAQKAAGAALGEELEQAARVAVDQRARDRPERQHARLGVEAVLARLALGEARRGDLRRGEDDPRQVREVEPLVLAVAQRVLRRGGATRGGDVDELRLAGHVASRIDRWDARALELVDDDRPALVGLNADGIQVEVFGVGDAAGRDEDLVDAHLEALPSRGALEHPVVPAEADSLGRRALEHDLTGVLEDPAHHRGDLWLLERRDPEQVDERYLRAEVAKHLPELEPDRVGADHRQPARRLDDLQRRGRSQVAGLLEALDRRDRRPGARRDQDRVGADRLA